MITIIKKHTEEKIFKQRLEKKKVQLVELVFELNLKQMFLLIKNKFDISSVFNKFVT